MAERLVICGGLPAPATTSKETIALDVSPTSPPSQRINLKLGDIGTRMVEEPPPVLIDLLEIAAYVYCADQFTGRGGETLPHMGRDWRRRFRFCVPVRCADLWRRPDVKGLLIETLGFLSDDDYAFDFVPHPNPDPPGIQPYLEFRDPAGAGFVPEDIILFSGGLDSLAGAVESLFGRGRKVALVSHRSSTTVMSKQSKLVMALRERAEAFRLFHVPVSVNKGQEEAVEFTQRARSFLFATLAMVVARLFRRHTMQFYENGIVSLNLPVAAHVLGARASRTTHPRMLADLSSLFSLILDEPVTVENPYLWKTKADVITTIADHGCADLIADSFSCARVREATRGGQHCGACSQCIDRRFGILSAGLGAYEPADFYAVDLLLGERRPGSDVVMAESYVLHASKLASMSERTFLNTFGQIFRVLPCLPGSQEENAAKLHELHCRHGRMVQNVIDQELVRHAPLAQSLSLPETSLLMLIQSAAARPPMIDPAEAEQSASEQAEGDDHGRALVRPLVFAIDGKHRKVLFRGGVEVGGVGFQVTKELAAEFGEDVASARSADEFRFVDAETLAGRVGIDEQGLRQRITRLRKSIVKKFLAALDVQLADDDVIQNDRGRGYRLNPYLLLVQPGQIERLSKS